MKKKAVSRGRGPRIRDEEIDRMIALYSEGKSFQAIGKELGRHWQSVRKYTIKALQERPGQELRREALKEALTAHFQDLVNALTVITQLVQLPDGGNWENEEWQPPTPDRRNRLLLEALKESHAEDSPLWDWWHSWNQNRVQYQKALGVLHKKVIQEIQNLEKKYSVSGIIMTEDLSQILFKKSTSFAKSIPIYDPSMLNVKSSKDQVGRKTEDELWLGQSTRLASGKDTYKLLIRVTKIMNSIDNWTEVQTLGQLFEEMSEIKDKIEEEIEVLSLRRAFPGRCRLCPV